jgi:hypothetical protein
MTRIVQFRRNTTSSVAAILGAPGELIVNTTLNTLTVHDGVTTGGTTLARNADLTTVSSNAYIAATTKATNTSYGIVQGNTTSILINNGIATLGSSITASWTIAQSSNGALYFYYAGVAKFRFDSSGTITAVNDLIAVGTI